MGSPARTVPRVTSALTAAEALRFARDVVERMGARAEDAERVAELLVRAEVGGHPVARAAAAARSTRRGWRDGTIVPSARRRDRARRGLDADAGRPARARPGRLHARGRPRGRARARARRGRRRGAPLGARRAPRRLRRSRLRARRRRCSLFANDSGRRAGGRAAGRRSRRGCRRTRSRPGIPRAQRAAPRDRSRDERRGLRQGAGAAGCRPAGARGVDARRPAAAARRRQGLRARRCWSRRSRASCPAPAPSRPIPGPDDQGVFLLAFDPARFGEPAELAERLEAMLGYVIGRAAASRAPSRCACRAAACRRCRSTRTRASSSRPRSPSGSRRWRASSASSRSVSRSKRLRRLVGEAARHRAAVDGQAGAVDVRGLVGERGTRSRRRAPPAVRRGPSARAGPRCAAPRRARCPAGSSESVIGVATVPGQHGVAADAVVGVVDADVARDLRDAGLGGAVDVVAGKATTPWIEATLTIAPPPLASMRRTATAVPYIGPLRSTRRPRSMCSASASCAPELQSMPALLTHARRRARGLGGVGRALVRRPVADVARDGARRAAEARRARARAPRRSSPRRRRGSRRRPAAARPRARSPSRRR